MQWDKYAELYATKTEDSPYKNYLFAIILVFTFLVVWAVMIKDTILDKQDSPPISKRREGIINFEKGKASPKSTLKFTKKHRTMSKVDFRYISHI